MDVKKQITFLNTPLIDIENIPSNSFVFFGLPIDNGGVFRLGSAEAPDYLRKMSLMYYYDDFEGLYDPETKSYLLENHNIVDLGNICKKNDSDWQNVVASIIPEILKQRSVPVALGGNHSITFPILSAYSERVQVIHLDAHSDYQRFDEAGAEPCGVVMRNVNGLHNVEKIVHIGVRGYLNSGQGIRDSIQDGNVFISCKDLEKDISGILKRDFKESLPIYISFDTDFLDPTICPGTTVPEPGGIDYLTAKKLLTFLASNYKVVGFDVVETNPLYDPSMLSGIFLSKLILDMLGALETYKD